LEGKEADSRTDIFAFGATVYEMATGKKAFEGKSQASLIAAIMEKDPPAMAELQPMTPPLFDRVVRRCLEKEPDERWQTAADLMSDLKWVTEVDTRSDPSPSFASPALWKRVIPWTLVFLAVVVAAVSTLTVMPSEERRVTRFSIAPPEPVQLYLGAIGTSLAISPDGNWIVYSADLGGNRQLYARAIDQVMAIPIPGTEGVRTDTFFSPDSQFVAFQSSGALKRVALAGGPVTTLCNTTGRLYGGSWGVDGTIIFTTPEGLYKVSAGGGEPELLAASDSEKGEGAYFDPKILPDGRAVLFRIRRSANEFDTALFWLETGEHKTLVEGARNARYAPTGHLVYALSGEGTLMAAPFDLERLELTGNSVPVLQEVRSSGTGSTQYAFSLDGTLVYVPDSGNLAQLVWVGRNGLELGPAIEEVLEYPRYQRISPDGTKVAVTVGPGGAGNLWVFDLQGQPAIPLTFEGHNIKPAWSPDGTRVAFSSNRGVTSGPDLYWMIADGSTLEPEILLESPGAQREITWSPDGQELIFMSLNSASQEDLLALPIPGDGEAREVIATDYAEDMPALSQNGRWLAYVSDVTGREEVWVRSYPDLGPPIRISANGGREPVWGGKDNEIFYYEGNKMMVAAVKTEPEFRVESVEMLFEGEYIHEATTPGSYDVGPGGRLLLSKRAGGRSTDEIRVVTNWFEELKRLVPTDN
jgi:serine/threonine-protein kinase